MKYTLLLAIVIMPAVASAQSLQGLIGGVLGFINAVLIPFILGIAFLVFLINVVRFFIIGGNNTEGQENSRSLALYGIGAFVLILSLWGIVNLLASGFGLNEGPCIDGTPVQSDYLYGINSLAPCSSPRPQPRPFQRPETSLPDSGFGTGVPISAPPGGVVGNPNPAGSGVIIPGRDTNPVSPTSSPILPNSFTPDGAPIGSSAYSRVTTLINETRSNATEYLRSDLRPLVGVSNLSAVQTGLFADITSPQAGVSERERIIAMLRLERLGVLQTGTAQSYFVALGQYETDIDLPIPSRTTNFSGMVIESTLAVPLPTTVVSQQANTRQRIETLLINDTDIYGKPKQDAQSRQVILTNLYDSTKTATQQIEYLDYLINSIVEDSNSIEAITAAGIRENYVGDLNTRTLFNGQTNLIQ
jgi:hypothetical protein